MTVAVPEVVVTLEDDTVAVLSVTHSEVKLTDVLVVESALELFLSTTLTVTVIASPAANVDADTLTEPEVNVVPEPVPKSRETVVLLLVVVESVVLESLLVSLEVELSSLLVELPISLPPQAESTHRTKVASNIFAQYITASPINMI